MSSLSLKPFYDSSDTCRNLSRCIAAYRKAMSLAAEFRYPKLNNVSSRNWKSNPKNDEKSNLPPLRSYIHAAH